MVFDTDILNSISWCDLDFSFMADFLSHSIMLEEIFFADYLS